MLNAKEQAEPGLPAMNRRILVIDDNRAVHDLLRRALTGHVNGLPARPRETAPGVRTNGEGHGGFEIDSAFQGHEGFTMVRKAIENGEPYAMAFVDGRMPPGWDGVETASNLWQVDPDIQVILCAAGTDYRWYEIIRELGQTDRLVILEKPFEQVEVLQIANALAEKWRLARILKTSPVCPDETVETRSAEMRTDHEKFEVEMADHLRDEHERLAMARHLLESQKLESLGVLAGGVAHDFNNLLTAIMGNAGLARMEMPEAAKAQAYLDKIQIACRRAADLCKQLLAYAGKSPCRVERLDLNAVINETAELVRVSIGKSVALRLNLADGLPAVLADPALARQALMNLVINASEAIGEKEGKVTLTTGVVAADRAFLAELLMGPTAAEGDYAFIEIQDDGCGMPPEVAARMFEPFFTTKFMGRGLGLSAVLGIIRAHKGAIQVRSEQGKGTTLRAFFPCVPALSAAPPGKGNPDAPWHGEGTVLVVDDEEIVREVVVRTLESLGLRVISAIDGQEGVELFKAHASEISLVLMDLSMPRLSGDAALREIHGLQPGARVVLMSGYSEQEARQKFGDYGLAGFLQKPFELKSLKEKLQTLRTR